MIYIKHWPYSKNSYIYYSKIVHDMLQRADTHVHTRYSGIGTLGPLRFPESVARPEDVVKNARSIGDDVLCITDHDSIRGALEAQKIARNFDDIEVVVGEEITTADGEIIGLWLNELIQPGLSAEETIDIIRSQGGITVAPHPFSLHVNAVGDLVYDLDLDAIETINAGHIDPYANKTAQEAAMRLNRWATLGASDAHSLPTMGHAWTEFKGEGAEGLRKAILRHETYARGCTVPLDKAIDWSIGVVMQADMQIIRSLLGLVRASDANDPIACKINETSTSKKLAGLFGSLIYLLPPMPHIASIFSTRYLNSKAAKQSLLPMRHHNPSMWKSFEMPDTALTSEETSYEDFMEDL